jgi:hypothetical protein
VEHELSALAQEQVDRQRGVVLKDTGDGLMVAFQSARRAVACAQEIQRAVARRNRNKPDVAVELRIGLHTGEVLSEDGGLHGETLIVAKRIESVASAGGIFASDTVHGVLGTARGNLEDRGQFALKGFDAPWHLWEVPWVKAGVTGVLPGRVSVATTHTYITDVPPARGARRPCPALRAARPNSWEIRDSSSQPRESCRVTYFEHPWHAGCYGG